MGRLDCSKMGQNSYVYIWKNKHPVSWRRGLGKDPWIKPQPSYWINYKSPDIYINLKQVRTG